MGYIVTALFFIAVLTFYFIGGRHLSHMLDMWWHHDEEDRHNEGDSE